MSIYGNYINESGLKSSIDKDFIKKEKLKLSSFKKEKITQTIIDKYKEKYKYLKHLRVQKNTEGYFWFKDDNIICTLMVEHKDNDEYWIQALEITKDYQGHGLSNQLLDVATKELHAEYLSVYKDNLLAKNIYEKYGFKVFDETKAMLMMKLSK